ncbi:MAG: hypothetical protein ACKO23_07735, partial [Gemmataceae bacterium]
KPLDLVKRSPLLPQTKDPKGKADRKIGEVTTVNTETSKTLAYLGTPDDVRRWYQGALGLEARLVGFGPVHANDPAVQFAVQSAKRQLGEVQPALEWYRQFAASQPDGPYRKAALAELWLNNRTGPAPKPLMTARVTGTKPFLDGKLDDVCWLEARPVKLQNAVGSTGETHPTEARICYDRDFLYLAVRCGHPEGDVGEVATTRTRDKDLRDKDRISLMLDLDRDYGTCFHLQVDSTGCVAEDCWGDKSWDPRWFVSVKHDSTGWTLEAALPRNSLTGDHITTGKAWAANIVRVLPGQGVQAFSLPAEAPEEAMRPEGMGLLLFTREAEQASTKEKQPAAVR